ncbi:MAG: serine/threonine protein kinase [Gemmatimonadaceae bacterium]|nr:serine/threonine protein kinase [Gemmatimonadaceae bacterium]
MSVGMVDTPNGAAKGGAFATDGNMLRDRITAAIGELYFIGAEVGRGGMAVVYSAEDVRLQRKVALKVLPPDLAFRSDVRERFVREAQTAARLNHPHIVPIYAVHESQGMVAFAMALVTGETLALRLQREPRPAFTFVANVLEQTSDALAYAHASGVVHRDVKPDNVLLDRDSGRAMVTDFGIARAAESGSRLTQTGIAVGTPAFMSPEQAMGDKDVDGRSDLYSVGVVAYLMLTGRLPFEAPNTPAMLMKHVSETPVPVRALRPDTPPGLAEIVERCLAKRPQDRWQSALQLRDALRHLQRGTALVPGNPMHGNPAVPHANGRGLVPYGAPPASPARTDRDEHRFGHRAEDWSPRVISEAEPAPRSYAAPGALPPIPQLPPLPAGADRGARREWKKANKEAIKDWRRAVRDQREVQQQLWREQQQAQRPARQVSRLRFWRRNTSTLPMPQGPLMTPAQIADRVVRFRKHVKGLAIASGVGTVSLVIGASFNAEPMLVPFFGGLLASVAFLQMSMMDFLKLRRVGVSPAAAWGEGWRKIAASHDTRSHEMKLQELVERHAGSTVLASKYGETVRNAADDRLVIQEITGKLSEADRMMVPDVEPTADALLERVGALASGLERLDRDLPGGVLPDLERRISVIEGEAADTPDHERRLSLLTRQRASLQELATRRDTMQRQLDNAAMALRSLRFDIVKLRTMGVDAAAHDLTSATQEARALSRDLGYVLDAAEESRRL